MAIESSMSDFKIAAAQVASIRGNIDENIATHEHAIVTAARHGISALVFPELSLIGYEPDLAAQLAIDAEDVRLRPLQSLARHHRMGVVVGAPIRNDTAKPSLGAILFTEDGRRSTYSKITLGGTEPSYFTHGSAPLSFAAHGHTIGIAICADSSQPSHPQGYAAAGASIYAACVFLSTEWYATDTPRLATYAERRRLLVVMANHGASVGTLTSVGKSAVWAPDGTLLVQAEAVESCLVMAISSKGRWHGDLVRL